MLSERIRSWATGAVGGRARLVSVTPLHAGAEPPWLLCFDRGGQVIKTVLGMAPAGAPLRVVRAVGTKMVTALSLAEQYQLPAPRVIATDLEGTVTGTPMLLQSFLPGSSAIPVVPSTDRLRAFGAAAASLRAARVQPTDELPLLASGIDVEHAAAERRRAMRYEAASWTVRATMLDEMCAAAGCDRDHARRSFTAPAGGRSVFLEAAEEQLRRIEMPNGETVLVHGDLWQGNTLWIDDQLTGIVDWDACGVGHECIDLGVARLDTALRFGVPAAAEVLAGWQHATGIEPPAEVVAYWDARAALNRPTNVGPWNPPTAAPTSTTPPQHPAVTSSFSRLFAHSPERVAEPGYQKALPSTSV